MNFFKNTYYKIKTAIDKKLDKFFEGKDRELITFVIAVVVNGIIIMGTSAVLIIRSLNWQKHPLTKNLIILYAITLIALIALTSLIKHSKRFAKNHKPRRKTTDDIAEEEVNEEMKNM